MDSLDASVQQSFEGLRTDHGWLHPVINEVDTLCGTIRTSMDKELSLLRESVQSAKMCEVDLHPVLEKLDTIVNPAFFSPDSHKVDVVEKNPLELHRVLEAIQSLKVCEVDLHPVLEKLDTIVSPAFFSPVLNKLVVLQKIEASQVATAKQMRAEFETLLDLVQQCREALLNAKMGEENLPPVLEKFETLLDLVQQCRE